MFRKYLKAQRLVRLDGNDPQHRPQTAGTAANGDAAADASAVGVGGVAAPPSLPHGWQEFYDHAGNAYFVHAATNRSQWER